MWVFLQNDWELQADSSYGNKENNFSHNLFYTKENHPTHLYQNLTLLSDLEHCFCAAASPSIDWCSCDFSLHNFLNPPRSKQQLDLSAKPCLNKDKPPSLRTTVKSFSCSPEKETRVHVLFGGFGWSWLYPSAKIKNIKSFLSDVFTFTFYFVCNNSWYNLTRAARFDSWLFNT